MRRSLLILPGWLWISLPFWRTASLVEMKEQAFLAGNHQNSNYHPTPTLPFFEIDSDWLKQFATSTSATLLSFINLYAKDFLIPVAPIHTANDMGTLAVTTYDQRSRLVHEGLLPPSELTEAATSAKQIVDAVLKALVTVALKDQPATGT